jgi:ATP-dependent helicase HrpB
VDSIVASDTVRWDAREAAVTARRQRRLGELVIADAPLARPDVEAVRAAMLEGLRQLGMGTLPWTKDLRAWQARVTFMRGAEPEHWPDVSDEALATNLPEWLGPFLDGVTRRDHLARLDLAGALNGLLTWDERRRLDQLAPTHLVVPSGSRVAIDDLGGPVPALAVRLQEVFGLADTPRIAGGRVPVMMRLLSPAQRPVQVTQDLKSFWQSGYHEVKKELKGRYPKHYWPDDPWTARPTRRAKPS